VSADPPDDGVYEELAALVTESPNPRTERIDRVPIEETLRLLNAEDALVAASVAREIPSISRLVERAVAALSRGGRIVYVGAGTSGRLGVLDAAECPPTFGTDPSQVVALIAGGDGAIRRSVEGAEDDEDAGRRAVAAVDARERDLVVGIAASRRTPFVVAALAEARRRGAATALVACAPRESIAIPVDVAVCPVPGPEAIMGSTRLKAGTAQKMVLNMLTTATMIQLGTVYRNMMVDLRATSRKLRERSIRTLVAIAGVDRARAAALLEEAGGSVKTAIVMARRGVPRGEAERLLRAADGRVGRALGETDA
jgi:N-acetylmuramic acid 6-phosphate etherase